MVWAMLSRARVSLREVLEPYLERGDRPMPAPVAAGRFAVFAGVTIVTLLALALLMVWLRWAAPPLVTIAP